MAEMQKKLGVTNFVSEIKHVENYHDDSCCFVLESKQDCSLAGNGANTRWP